MFINYIYIYILFFIIETEKPHVPHVPVKIQVKVLQV